MLHRSRRHEEFSSLSGLGVLGDLGSNSVHVGSTLLGEGLSDDGASSFFGFVRDFTNEGCSLEFNKNVSDAFSGGESAVLGAGSVSLLGSVVLSEGGDSNLSSHVELVGDGGSSDVEPVWVVWGEVLETGCFIVNGPLWHLDSVSFFQMLGWNILDGSTVMCVKNSELNIHLCVRLSFLFN